jgi:serine phosphatase RsbU (regulator of sigma subunit)
MRKIYFISCLIVTLFRVNSSAYSQSKSEILLKRANEIFNRNYNVSFDLCCQAEKINEIKFIGEVSLCKARYFITFTDYENAEIELGKSISFFKSKNDYSNLSDAYDLKSILLSRLGDSQSSTFYLIKAYQLSKKSKDTSAQIKRLINLTHTFVQYEDLSKADFYLNLLESLKPNFDNTSFYFLNQNKGTYYLALKDYKRAIKHYKRALKIAEINKMIDSKATILMLLAKAYRISGKYNEADKYANFSYQFSKNNKLIYEKSEALGELIQIQEKLKNYQKAYALQEEFIDVEKQIINTEKLNRVAAIQNRLALTEKENIITKQNNKIAKEELINSKNEIQNQKLFILIIVLILISGFVLFIFYKTKKLNQTIKSQSKLVQSQNKDIKDSIRYAERIQQAILPPLSEFSKKFPNSFIFHRPKDILSGDFYWIEENEDFLFVAAADCTGHGVPGALISIVNYNLLNKAVLEKNINDPAEILNAVNNWLTESLHQTYNTSSVKDGMDVSLIAINKKTKELKFAGAFNSIYIANKSILREFKGDKFPVGMFVDEKPKPFKTHSINIEQDDMIYLFTDGFPDQFGGQRGKKYKYKNFKNLLIEMNQLSISEQNLKIQREFDEWKGNFDQVDDVLIIGIKPL